MGFASHKVALAAGHSCLIGRGSQCDLFLPDPAVSRIHASVAHTSEGWILCDEKSTTGTWLGAENIVQHPLHDGDIFRIGVQRIRFILDAGQAILEHLDASHGEIRRAFHPGETITFGRHNCDISLEHPQCPARLGTLRHCTDYIGSTFPDLPRLKIPSIHRIALGTLEIQAEELVWTPRPLGYGVEVSKLSFVVGERSILSKVSFSLRSGELLAVIGRSGQGKSTLLHALAGHHEPSSGTIYVEGLAPQHPHVRQGISWLRQDVPLHEWLTVQECLQDAARLRLPHDTSAPERARRVESLLQQLGLQGVANSITRTLSGGEKRRTALAVELLAAPGLLLLDEPFAGLDPLHVDRLISWFRQICWGGKSICLSTHDYGILPHCDQVLILHEGSMAFWGSPEEALLFFNAQHPHDILSKLASKSGTEWYESYLRTRPGLGQTGEHAALPHRYPGIHTRHQFSFPLVFMRFGKSLWRDRGRFWATLLQPIIIAALLALLFKPGSSLWVAAFSLNLCANWFGMATAIREVIQEKDLIAQEFQRGLSPFAYFSAKLLALFAVALPQTLLCYGVLVWKLDISSAWRILPIVASILPPIAAGLAASSRARTPGQANALLPLLLIPQLMFAGALVPQDQMHPIGQWIARLLWSSWTERSLQNLFTEGTIRTLDLIIPTLMAFGIVIITAWVAKPTNRRSTRSTSTTTTR